MKNVIMPKLSDTMTEGLLGNWLKSVGDPVARGDIIAEVETDKATMGLEAFDSGILLEQRVKAGETVPVGTILGIIGSADEKPAGAETAPSSKNGSQPEPATIATPVTTEKEAVLAEAATDSNLSKASPVVRRRARELGINLDHFQGSGSFGRILLEDLERLTTGQQNLSQPASLAETGSSPDKPAAQNETVLPLSRMRSAIARTVTASWRDIPHFSVTSEVRMDNVEELRRQLKASGQPVSLNELVMKAAANALLKYPLVNASFIDGNIVMPQEVNIGLMVKVDTGLLVPVIRGCQSLSLAELAAKSRQLIHRARSGSLAETDLLGGTFSISNLGAYGVRQFSAIILPPQVAILAVGTVYDRLLPGKGGPMPARLMKLTLSADHRVLDGVAAAEFLQELKLGLENPVRLLL